MFVQNFIKLRLAVHEPLGSTQPGPPWAGAMSTSENSDVLAPYLWSSSVNWCQADG